jgi:enamine deaminase RidA (YjgF/YER057c/UK114 family)
MNIIEKLKDLHITLPPPPAKGGLYTPVKLFGPGNKLAYVSGCGSGTGDGAIIGKVGAEVTLDQGYEAARRAMLNVLANLNAFVPGGLDAIKNCVKVLTLVASADGFYEQPKVANGGTQLLIDLWGQELGAPTRSAIGVNVLPGNIPVETEGIFELE